MRLHLFSYYFILCLLVSVESVGQIGSTDRFGRPTPDARGWTDPALRHSQMLGQGSQIIIGAYKVTGSPYLFGERHNADIFTPKEKAHNISISYNTYNQEVEFYSTSNPNQSLIKEVGEVDSFILKKDSINFLMQDIHFTYGPLIGSDEKTYFQVIQNGPRISLYKRYISELGYPSTYGQSDLRQFDLIAEYFYFDSQEKKFKKIKPNLSILAKEFKSIKDITPVANKDLFVTEPEEVMKKIINYLNS